MKFSQALSLAGFIIFALTALTYAQRLPPPRPALFSPPPSSEFVKFTSPAEEFSAVFPGKAEVNEVDDDLAIITSAKVSREGAEWRISQFKFKDGISKSDAEIREVLRGTLTKDGKLSDIKAAPPTQGRTTYSLETFDGYTLRSYRFVIGKSSIFQLAVSFWNWHIISTSIPNLAKSCRDEIDRFVSSFAVTREVVAMRWNNEPEPKSNIDLLGIIEPARYVNKPLGFVLKIPETWTVVAPEDIEAFRSIGAAAMKSTDRSFSRLLEESMRREIMLVMLKSDSIENGVVSNVIASTIVNKVAETDLIALAKPTRDFYLKSSSMTEISELSLVRIGKTQAASFSTLRTVGTVNLAQRVYILLRRGHVLAIVTSAAKGRQDEEIQKSLELFDFEDDEPVIVARPKP